VGSDTRTGSIPVCGILSDRAGTEMCLALFFCAKQGISYKVKYFMRIKASFMDNKALIKN
jgi:hypothetical protein